MLRGKILVSTLEIRCAASFKTTAAQRISDPSHAQDRALTPTLLGKFCTGGPLQQAPALQGAGPARCLAAGGASPSRQKDHWLLISSGTHSGFPAPASVPARLLLCSPLRECQHTQPAQCCQRPVAAPGSWRRASCRKVEAYLPSVPLPATWELPQVRRRGPRTLSWHAWEPQFPHVDPGLPGDCSFL